MTPQIGKGSAQTDVVVHKNVGGIRLPLEHRWRHETLKRGRTRVSDFVRLDDFPGKNGQV